MVADVYVSTISYCKMVLHSIKYPHCAVKGILLGTRQISTALRGTAEETDREDRPRLNVLDVVPAIHSSLLAPQIETLLIHLDDYCQEEQIEVIGLYFSNQLLADDSLDECWARIAAEKVKEPLLLQINNSRLSLNSTSPCLETYLLDSGTKWQKFNASVENSDDTVSATSLAIQNKLHRCLVDFENHLDDPLLCDFYNLEVNQKLLSLMH